MKDKERQLFGSLGLSLTEACDIAYSPSGTYSVKRTAMVQPPASVRDERVPAAKTILDRAQANPTYRRLLVTSLNNPTRLAAFLADSRNRPPGRWSNPWGVEGPLTTNQQLHRDLNALLNKLPDSPAGYDLIGAAAAEASLIRALRRPSSAAGSQAAKTRSTSR
jgi:hypothetical protein